MGRFVNADHPEYSATSPEDLVQYNLYAYCLNNPLNRTDADGNWSLPNWAKVVVGAVALVGAIALTVATGGGAAAVAVGVAKVVGSVALSTAISAGTGYLTGGVQGAIDGACNGFMYGSLSACAGAALKYITSPANGIDSYANLKKEYKGSGLEAHHIVEKRLAPSLNISNTNNMLSVELTKAEHKVFTKAWKMALPYSADYSKKQIFKAAVKIYIKKPRLLISAIKTIL